ncbi:MAG: hypothetical protein HOP02_04685 [Methylococcaceae bacterium]|nr:hypothetical protein [Methylococcaceae bacterium]
MPQTDCSVPLAQWKRPNAVQDALLGCDKNLADSLGGVITPEEYGALVMKGEVQC